MMKRHLFPFLAILLLALPAAAQETAPSAAASMAAKPDEPFMQSFLFTPAEMTLIRQASAGTVSGAAVLEAATSADIPLRRVISLSGVVYRKPGDWIVWLNGQKVTPKNLLPDIVDIKVSQDKVHLKWFDKGLNDIISITLRPHQTYDIVTGVLLPG